MATAAQRFEADKKFAYRALQDARQYVTDVDHRGSKAKALYARLARARRVLEPWSTDGTSAQVKKAIEYLREITSVLSAKIGPASRREFHEQDGQRDHATKKKRARDIMNRPASKSFLKALRASDRKRAEAEHAVAPSPAPVGKSTLLTSPRSKVADVLVYSRPSGYWYAQAHDAKTGARITDASGYSREEVLSTLRQKFAMIGVSIKSIADEDPYAAGPSSHHAMKKKSAAQLKREIDEVLGAKRH